MVSVKSVQSLPVFPNFKLLDLHDKKAIYTLTHRYPPYSDFNFTSMWSYNTENDVLISTLNSNFVMCFRDYVTNEPFYSFIGTVRSLETVKTLLNYAKNKGQKNPYLKLIPEINVLHLQGNHNFIITEDPDNFDYILSVKELAYLQSPKSYSRRRDVSRFTKKNPEFRIIELNLADASIKNQIFTLFKTWEVYKGKSEDDTKHEFTAVKRVINDASYLELLPIGVYIHELLVGWLIVDIENAQYAQTHFLKYDPRYEGIRTIMHHAIAQKLDTMHYKFINIEQDLGIAGLRFAKQQSDPIMYLKKYIITYR